MIIVPQRRLYLTALSILLVVLFLLVVISVSTYRNLTRERDAAMETVHRQALTLINALEAGARAGTLMQMTGRDAIGNLVHEIGRSADVNYIYLVNAEGQVVHHSIPSLEGTRASWRPVFEHGVGTKTRLRRLNDGTHVYEVAKPFSPMGPDVPGMAMGRREQPADIDAHFHPWATVYLGMTLTSYETARSADLQHAMIMGGIVLALGGGVIYFFIVIRSYYLLSRRLQDARDYTRQVIASMVHGVLSIDNQGKVVSGNQQARTLLHLPEIPIEGLDLMTIFDFDETGIAQTLAGGLPVLNHEVTLFRESGDPLPLMMTVSPLQDEGGIRNGAVVVLRDMRAIKALEAQVRRSERLAAIGRLAAGVAHEIRNPLSSIRGFAYLLGRGDAGNSSAREYADVMVREIDRINHVVTDLLNFARPMQVEPQTTAIPELIAHVIALVSGDADSQQVEIRVDCPADLPPMVLDPNQVTQALLNLLLNAIHSLEGGGVIRIGGSAMRDRCGVVIQVEDNGPGIEPAIQEKIFEPFFTTRERGTGLGLAMVRKIAENHGGDVRMESPLPGRDNGSRFTLVLRTIDPPAASAAAPRAVPDGESPRGVP